MGEVDPVMDPHKCPVDGCSRSRGDRQLMCKKHWYMVPKELRDNVYRTARRMWDGEGGATHAWSEAADAAVAAVEEKEAGGE